MKSPPGYDDFLTDANAVPMHGRYEQLLVPGVGMIAARRPVPRSAAALAQSSNGKLDAVERLGYFNLFIADHVPDAQVEDILLRMVQGEVNADAMQKVSRALATWGTARPFTAVINLIVITAFHWRSMRAKMMQTGIVDPLRGLTSMHALLDFSEQVTLESLARSGQGSNAGEESQRNIDSFMFKLYAPDPTEITEAGRVPIPAGFDEDAMESNFDAFMKMGG